MAGVEGLGLRSIRAPRIHPALSPLVKHLALISCVRLMGDQRDTPLDLPNVPLAPMVGTLPSAATARNCVSGRGDDRGDLGRGRSASPDVQEPALRIRQTAFG